jgi:hypothetical protein
MAWSFLFKDSRQAVIIAKIKGYRNAFLVSQFFNIKV